VQTAILAKTRAYNNLGASLKFRLKVNLANDMLEISEIGLLKSASKRFSECNKNMLILFSLKIALKWCSRSVFRWNKNMKFF